MIVAVLCSPCSREMSVMVCKCVWVYRTITLNTAECGGEGWCVLRGVTSTELTLHDDSGCGGAASLSEETSLLDMES